MGWRQARAWLSPAWELARRSGSTRWRNCPASTHPPDCPAGWEQVAGLLGQDMPRFLTEATREAHLMAMLGDAARACHDDDSRLILVVAGLDEDTGVTAGAG
jgi:hypothetical protein